MNSTERVRTAILGEAYDRQPIYGWVYANPTDRITERWGSVAAFEDKFEFDAAFGIRNQLTWLLIYPDDLEFAFNLTYKLARE